MHVVGFSYHKNMSFTLVSPTYATSYSNHELINAGVYGIKSHLMTSPFDISGLFYQQSLANPTLRLGY